MVEDINVVKEDYYEKYSKSKVGDFFIGLFMLPVLYFIWGTLQSFIGSLFFGGYSSIWPNSSITNMFVTSIVLSILLPLVLAIFLERKYFKERRYVRIGMICAVVIPVIIFGACVSIILIVWS